MLTITKVMWQVSKLITFVNNHYYYSGLLDRDLEPLSLLGKLVSYFKVFVFLIGSLIFWIIFGWFADYSFPFNQAIELILCCFNRNIGSKINNLQKNLQTVAFTSQSDNKEQIRKLNKLESQAWLYRTHLGSIYQSTSPVPTWVL